VQEFGISREWVKRSRSLEFIQNVNLSQYLITSAFLISKSSPRIFTMVDSVASLQVLSKFKSLSIYAKILLRNITTADLRSRSDRFHPFVVLHLLLQITQKFLYFIDKYVLMMILYHFLKVFYSRVNYTCSKAPNWRGKLPAAASNARPVNLNRVLFRVRPS